MKTRKTYLFIFVLVPVMIIVAAIGWYKFFLPDGIAAVVNGENITTTELDAAAVRAPGIDETTYRRYRYDTLNRLITETLALQEARKAGMRVSGEEISAASAEASYGLSASAFRHQVEQLYGSERQFEKALKRRLLITKYVRERIIPKGADQQTARLAVNTWTRALPGNATVRVSFSEQSTNYSCCVPGGGTAATRSNSPNCSNAPAQGSLAPEQANAARDAGLAYWHKKYGQDAVTAKVIDFGCHIQVDIQKNKKTVGSLIYQSGTVVEM